MAQWISACLCDPSSIPVLAVLCGLTLLLFLALHPGVFPGSSVFLPPQKPTLPNSNLISTRAAGLSVSTLLCVFSSINKFVIMMMMMMMMIIIIITYY